VLVELSDNSRIKWGRTSLTRSAKAISRKSGFVVCGFGIVREERGGLRRAYASEMIIGEAGPGSVLWQARLRMLLIRWANGGMNMTNLTSKG
jgi:hypothetical protein